jgi:hypothetical protein
VVKYLKIPNFQMKNSTMREFRMVLKLFLGLKKYIKVFKLYNKSAKRSETRELECIYGLLHRPQIASVNIRLCNSRQSTGHYTQKRHQTRLEFQMVYA